MRNGVSMHRETKKERTTTYNKFLHKSVTTNIITYNEYVSSDIAADNVSIENRDLKKFESVYILWLKIYIFATKMI